MRQAWYKSLLKTCFFDKYFRSDDDYVNYTALHHADKMFLLTERAAEEQGAAHQNVRDSLSDGNDLVQYKLDILYLSPSIHLSKVQRCWTSWEFHTRAFVRLCNDTLASSRWGTIHTRMQ